ncbi:MAG: hypothetical protein HQK63_13680 [Desulfamplus sp.]|nr:hypothetical protein [Desulfamplus sp.]
MTIINDPISTNSISEEEKEILSCFKNSNIHPSPIEITAILKKRGILYCEHEVMQRLLKLQRDEHLKFL